MGLGNLGLPVAQRLTSVGTEVLGFDVSAASLESAAGVGIAPSIRQLTEWSDVVLVLVSDAEQSEAVISGPEGITAASSPPRIVVLMATVGPDAVASLAAPLVEAGSGLVDAPVSGGAHAALAGGLSLMVGGAARDIDACLGGLENLGSVHLLGALGAGQTAKLANQMVFFGAQAALQEAVELAESHGVDCPALLEALSAGTADCWAVRHWGFIGDTARAYEAAGVDPGHRPWRKDLAAAAHAARTQGLDAPVTDVVSRVFGERADREALRN